MIEDSDLVRPDSVRGGDLVRAEPYVGLDGPLAEFVALRSEMELRGKHQNDIVALQLTVTGAIFSFAVSRPDLFVLMLIIPVSSYLLCGRYAAQHGGILRIARYIRDELSPKIPGGLGWEQWIRTSRRPDRFLGWFLPFLLVFPGASLLALAWTSRVASTARPATPADGLLMGIWWTGALATCVSTYLLLRIYLRRR